MMLGKLQSGLSWITSKNTAKTTPPNQQEIQNIFENLGYDFEKFTLSSFIKWIENADQVQIHLVPLHFPPTYSGALIKCPSEKRHYIFYDAQASLLLQTHIILHEIGHYLCGHSGMSFHKQEWSKPQNLVNFITVHAPQADQVFYRNVYSEEQENEAELFATLVQKNALQHVAIENLLLSDNSSYQTYLKSIGSSS